MLLVNSKLKYSHRAGIAISTSFLLNNAQFTISMNLRQLVPSSNANLVVENYSDFRKTPLYFAISNGDTTCAEMLLAAGARTNLDPLRCILVAVRAERSAEIHVHYTLQRQGCIGAAYDASPVIRFQA